MGARKRLVRYLLLYAFVSCSLALYASVQAQTIFLVRHAERAAISGSTTTDTHLSEAGRQRAQALANMLKDAKITAIYTTEYKRTQETAAPLASSLGMQPEVVFADDTATLVPKLKASQGNVLVVGHSNTLPHLINALGVSSRITIAESDYDNLFLIDLDRGPRLIHLHYR